MSEQVKFRKAYCANPAPRLAADKVKDIADEMIYVCDSSIFDDTLGDEYKFRFEDKVKEAMDGFDPVLDVIVFFGDALIFAMMIISIALDEGETLNIARYSQKADMYIIRPLKYDDLAPV